MGTCSVKTCTSVSKTNLCQALGDGSFENSQDDLASVSVLHLAALSASESSKRHAMPAVVRETMVGSLFIGWNNGTCWVFTRLP
jgi:hypothetical protein